MPGKTVRRRNYLTLFDFGFLGCTIFVVSAMSCFVVGGLVSGSLFAVRLGAWRARRIAISRLGSGARQLGCIFVDRRSRQVVSRCVSESDT